MGGKSVCFMMSWRYKGPLILVALFLDASLVLGKAGKSHYSCLSKMIEKETPEIKEKGLEESRNSWESRSMMLSHSVVLPLHICY